MKKTLPTLHLTISSTMLGAGMIWSKDLLCQSPQHTTRAFITRFSSTGTWLNLKASSTYFSACKNNFEKLGWSKSESDYYFYKRRNSFLQFETE